MWPPGLEGKISLDVTVCTWKFPFALQLTIISTNSFTVYSLSANLSFLFITAKSLQKRDMNAFLWENNDLLLLIFLSGLRPEGILQPGYSCLGLSKQ
jgi:hypothetical protein